ncbi:hypothetical protein NT01EI_3410 [Edwardsiella ictaluri 93-146]|uniref:Uncharacterized protein n=1 Tax=Edwardsiella ictaluri (strain 93-146) TaxID=634503 RepID=C5BAZ2_EDWI9|nr:hypothetical protein NT01EI_3410 [Edwardsiella ictaluri 93-146]
MRYRGERKENPRRRLTLLMAENCLLPEGKSAVKKRDKGFRKYRKKTYQ